MIISPFTGIGLCLDSQHDQYRMDDYGPYGSIWCLTMAPMGTDVEELYSIHHCTCSVYEDIPWCLGSWWIGFHDTFLQHFPVYIVNLVASNTIVFPYITHSVPLLWWLWCGNQCDNHCSGTGLHLGHPNSMYGKCTKHSSTQIHSLKHVEIRQWFNRFQWVCRRQYQ